MHALECALKVRVLHQPACKILAPNHVVNVDEQIFYARIDLIQVCRNRNARIVGPACRLRSRLGLMSIHMQHARIHNPFALQFLRPQGHTLIAPAHDGPFAASVHQDQRLWAHAP